VPGLKQLSIKWTYTDRIYGSSLRYEPSVAHTSCDWTEAKLSKLFEALALVRSGIRITAFRCNTQRCK